VIITRLDKIEIQCQADIKAERDTRTTTFKELRDDVSEQQLRSRSYFYQDFRKLEQRILDLEPGAAYDMPPLRKRRPQTQE